MTNTQIIDLEDSIDEPVDLTYAKTFLRIDHDHEDDLIIDLIRAARIRVEQMIDGSLVSRLRRYKTNQFSGSGLYLSHLPIASVTRVTIINAFGEFLELDPLIWRADLRSIPARIQLIKPYRWSSWKTDFIEVDVSAGYGAPDAVPSPLKQAVLLLLAQSYEYRGEDKNPSLPIMAEAILMPYRSLKL